MLGPRATPVLPGVEGITQCSAVVNRQIRHLYRLEGEIRLLGPTQRFEIRQERALRLYREFHL